MSADTVTVTPLSYMEKQYTHAAILALEECWLCSRIIECECIVLHRGIARFICARCELNVTYNGVLLTYLHIKGHTR